MRTSFRTALLALLTLGLAGAASPASAAGAEPVIDCDSIVSTTVLDAPSTRLCDVLDALVGGARTTLYQEVRPDGKWGNLDCVYDSLANRSVIVEWWQIWVEAGTIDSSGNRNPIVGTYVYYLWATTAVGDVC